MVVAVCLLYASYFLNRNIDDSGLIQLYVFTENCVRASVCMEKNGLLKDWNETNEQFGNNACRKNEPI
jgi:hypothetical protein